MTAVKERAAGQVGESAKRRSLPMGIFRGEKIERLFTFLGFRGIIEEKNEVEL